jgi:hypothetical protein
LKELEVSVENIESLPPSGESLPAEIRKRVSRADFVCGILEHMRSSQNVLFELGIAVGCERPIFVVAESADLIPFSLSSYPHVLGVLRDHDVVRFHLSVFLKNLRRTARRAKQVLAFTTPKEISPTAATVRLKSSPPQVEVSDGLEIVRRELDQATSEVQLTRAVAQAFKVYGARVAAEAEIGDDARPDVVAWLNEPASDLGAALLVQTKSTIRDRRRREESVSQVARYMSAAGMRTGLLLALDADDEIKVRIVPAGYVFITSPNTLLALLSRGRLMKDLAEARNRFVHSGA